MALSTVLRVVAGLTFMVGFGNGYYDIDDSMLFKISFDRVHVPDVKLGSETTAEQKDAPEPPPTTSPDFKGLVGEEETEQLTIVTKRNEKYVCQLPKPKLKGINNEDTYKGDTALEMLSPLFKSKACSFRLESYWNYELCHGRFLRQVHEDRDGNIVLKKMEYNLGKYDEKTLDADIAALRSQVEEGIVKKPKKKRIESIDMPYYEMVMRDGTVCDLTGYPRVTRVQYLCYPPGKHEIYSFKETSTCEYEVIILSPILCAHPDYRPESAQEHVVNCLPADGKGERKPMDLILQEKENVLQLPKQGVFQGEFSPGDQPGIVKITIKEVGANRGQESEEEEDSGESYSHGSSHGRSAESRSHFVPVTDLGVVREFLLGRHCLYGGSGWWRYEFCYGKHVNQYHEEGKSRVSEINLGRFDELEHRKWLDENPSKQPDTSIEKRKTVSHHYSGGDHCDIIDKPRTVEVRLKCRQSESLSAVSLYLLEPKTCEYVLVVESRIICDILPRADQFGLMKLTLDDFDDSEPKPEDGKEERPNESDEEPSEFGEKQEGLGSLDPQPVEKGDTKTKVEVGSDGGSEENVKKEREFTRSELKSYLDDLLDFMKHDKDFEKFKDFLIEENKDSLIAQLNNRLTHLSRISELMFKDFIHQMLKRYRRNHEEESEESEESDAKTEL